MDFLICGKVAVPLQKCRKRIGLQAVIIRGLFGFLSECRSWAEKAEQILPRKATGRVDQYSLSVYIQTSLLGVCTQMQAFGL